MSHRQSHGTGISLFRHSFRFFCQIIFQIFYFQVFQQIIFQVFYFQVFYQIFFQIFNFQIFFQIFYFQVFLSDVLSDFLRKQIRDVDAAGRCVGEGVGDAAAVADHVETGVICLQI